jgi:hypothetical protein
MKDSTFNTFTGLIVGFMFGVLAGVLFMSPITDDHLQVRNKLQEHVHQQIQVGNAFYDPKTAELKIAVCGKKGSDPH